MVSRTELTKRTERARRAKAGPVASAVRQETGMTDEKIVGDWNERRRDGSSPKGLHFRVVIISPMTIRAIR